MYCPECGAENEQGASFCGECGSELPGEDEIEGLEDESSTAESGESADAGAEPEGADGPEADVLDEPEDEEGASSETVASEGSDDDDEDDDEDAGDEASEGEREEEGGVVCDACGAKNEPDVRFCGECGKALASGAEAAPATGGRKPARGGGPEEVTEAEDSNGRRVFMFRYPRGDVFTDGDLAMIREAAERASALSHGGVAPVLSATEDDDGVSVTVLRMPGVPLDRWRAKREPVEAEEVIAVAKPLLATLSYAHKEEILHGALSPENILVDEDGTVSVLGFGFRAVVRDLKQLRWIRRNEAMIYMSPEQIMAGAASEATDIYAVGVLLYELLTGRPPFLLGDLALQHVQGVPAPVKARRSDVTEALSKLVMKCLEKEPERRYQTADDLLDEVGEEALVGGEPGSLVLELEAEEPADAEAATDELISFESRTFDKGEIDGEGILGFEEDLEQSDASGEETALIESLEERETVMGESWDDGEEGAGPAESAVVEVSDEVRDLFERGLRFHNEGNYTEAINCYTEAIGVDTNFAPAYSNRALGYYDMGEFDTAIQDFTRAIELNPRFADAHLGRGLAYYKKGQLKLAVADYQQALRCDPENVVTHYNSGIAHYDLGEFDQAIKDYTEVLDRDPEHATAYYNRGIANYKTGNWDDAIRDFNEALELNESHHTAYYNRGSIYHKMKDYEKALSDLSKAIQIKPDYVMAYYNRGNVCTKLGRLEDAIRDYTEVIKLAPNFVQAYFSRGCIYGNIGEYLKAVRDFDQAVALNPNYGAAYWNRAIAYEMLGYKKKARVDFEKADELNYKPK